MMIEEKKRQIADALSKRLETIVCPMCHQSRYTLIDGYVSEPVQDDYKKVVLGGRMIPSVMLVCNHCGHIDRFALGVLGLLEGEKIEKNSEKNTDVDSLQKG